MTITLVVMLLAVTLVGGWICWQKYSKKTTDKKKAIKEGAESGNEMARGTIE